MLGALVVLRCSGCYCVCANVLLCRAGKLELDGIFRISAKVNEVNELMTAIDKGLYDAANWGTVNPYALAALLKMYFRELPDPLFPFECYDPIIAAAGKST